MEAIHPKASKPLEMAKIKIRIKSTFEPDHPGTLISNDYVAKNRSGDYFRYRSGGGY